MDLIAQARQHSLGDLTRRTAQRVPSKLAIVDGEIRYTHLEFADLVDRTAAGRSADGIVKGDRVALLSHHSWQFAAVAFAAARIGSVLGPLNILLGPAPTPFN